LQPIDNRCRDFDVSMNRCPSIARSPILDCR
jgi:hypothetical protein